MDEIRVDRVYGGSTHVNVLPEDMALMQFGRTNWNKDMEMGNDVKRDMRKTRHWPNRPNRYWESIVYRKITDMGKDIGPSLRYLEWVAIANRLSRTQYRI